MAMLSVNDLNVYYGSIHAIKGISFEVNEGEIVTLIGANGAGKSTTLNTVAGLLRPKKGTVEFEGESLAGVPAHKVIERGIALCPEGRRIFLMSPLHHHYQKRGFHEVKIVNRFWIVSILLAAVALVTLKIR